MKRSARERRNVRAYKRGIRDGESSSKAAGTRMATVSMTLVVIR